MLTSIKPLDENNDESSICANIKNINDSIEGLYKAFTYEDGNISKIEEKDSSNLLILKKEVLANKEDYTFRFANNTVAISYEQKYESNNILPRPSELNSNLFSINYDYDDL